ncbi:glycosyltransferase family 2 protein [Apibacter muscae]|uniref:glycosyltransferase family 2 protein n=1 Tax=Apibacter muscae TaxID=2509004 RepID=UPI0011AC1C46|nr:glycosyltransferase family 2 protein [Apibacter muscae]TWP31200.1 glycosyltransferase family 2 protein [Apibacter muscae]
MVKGLITVVIPCYNSSKFIKKTLDSLLKQTYQKLQILCINDGSKDDTYKILKEYSNKYKYIQIINKENGGIESVLKASLSLIEGEYTFLHGHDDYLSYNAFERAIGSFTEDLDAIRLDLFFVDEHKTIYKMQDRRILEGRQALIETIGWNIHTFCVWRTNKFKDIVHVDTKGMMNFDELATRFLYSKSRKVGYCEGIYYYYQHSESVSKKKTYRFYDRVYTNVLLRKLLIDVGVYNEISTKFENEIYEELISMHLIYNENKLNYATEFKKRIKAILKDGFTSLNGSVLVNESKIFKRRHRLVYLIGRLSLYNYSLFKLLVNRKILR